MTFLMEENYKYSIGDWGFYIQEGNYVYRKLLDNGQEAIVAETGNNVIYTQEELEFLLKNNATPRASKENS